MNRILILGAGALGSNIVANLVADNRNNNEITVLDYDTVEERNITAGTQFYTRQYLGLLKTEALQAIIYDFYEKEIQIINDKLTGESLLSSFKYFTGYDVLVDCFDNFPARRLTQDAWIFGEESKPLLHAGFSPEMTFSLEWAENYTPLEEPIRFDICELPGAGSFIKMVAALTSTIVQDYLETGTKEDYIGNKFTIKKLL